ncbi:tumor necrosis factor ligand superfamily member 18 [Centroberyx affinis]|uniref:tumor necrosis factor ligand superfamily member 18 n=1 Tax=Centroberyx affinis TaxID=166261 RepID=UPI003A5BB0C1
MGDVALESTIQGNNDPSTKPDLVKIRPGLTLTFKATQAPAHTETIEWTEKKENPGLMSSANQSLTIKKDGNYFLCLQVTLDTEYSHRGTQHTVSLNKNGQTFLEGRINTNLSISTGFMGRLEQLVSDDILKVTIHPSAKINDTLLVTYLDVIYLPNRSTTI